MRGQKKTEERAIGFPAAACYLVSGALCGLAAYALAQLSGAATGAAARGLYPLLGIF